MVSRLRPMAVNVVIEDRPYKLGDVMSVVVEASVRGDVEVREGRVELVYEERWLEVWETKVPVRTSGAGSDAALTRGAPPTTMTKQQSKSHKDTHVSSSAVLVEGTWLNSGAAYTYSARLEIPLEIPVHGPKANVTWWLVATFDIASARDITKRRELTVTR